MSTDGHLSARGDASEMLSLRGNGIGVLKHEEFAQQLVQVKVFKTGRGKEAQVELLDSELGRI